MTYAELVQKIRDYTEVSSTVLTDAIVNDFIEDAEFRILRDVDSDGVGQANNRDFLQWRDTSFMLEFNPAESTGVPKYYSWWDKNHIVFAPTPNANYKIQLNYILKDPGLSATNTTTYISLNFPNGLLYACLVEAYGFLKGPQDLLQLYEQKYKQVVEGFAIEQMGRRRRDEYQSGVPRVGK